jgi:nucleoside-diphosphate-sugar epimerase
MPTVFSSPLSTPENAHLFKTDAENLTKEICRSIWTLSAEVNYPESYLKLVGLTNDLISIYEQQGRLNKHPFSSARERKLSLPFEILYNKLKGTTCVITGGLGCIGSVLTNVLLEFKVKKIIILDINVTGNSPLDSKEIIKVQCDVRDLSSLQNAFLLYRPDYVFHTAAQRDPGYAEKYIAETTSINVLGTFNVMQACESVSTVKQMVYASTGKSSRYFTEEVYAATKKIGEFVIDAYAKESTVKYSIVRFTHVLENSLMNSELRESSENAPYLSVHSPGKYVTAQNATEAAFLMLNSLVYSEEKQCNLLLVRNLEWPVESLEVALYYAKQSGRSLPIVFVGNPVGYCEKFFRGQFDWSNPAELNLLTNVYERKYRKLNSHEDIIITRPCSADKTLIKEVIEKINGARGDIENKKELTGGLKELVRESLKKVDKEDTVDILRWGLDPKFVQLENVDITKFNALVSLLVESLAGSKYDKEIEDHNYQAA